MDDNLTARERRLRRALSLQGFRLHKTPARSCLRGKYGVGFMVSNNNLVEFGLGQREYEASLMETEEWAADFAV